MSAEPCLLMTGVLVASGFPHAGTLICVLALGVQLIVMAVRMTFAGMSAPLRPSKEGHDVAHVFSVHVAIHDEPPDLVAETLRALARQDWPADRREVIVIDNNTVDPALWTPVRDLCERLGPPFRFLHRMGVTGAKAGALDIALSRTRADATHIVTVDADYVVDPGFLSIASRALRETGADYVQFPQAYSGCERVAAGVDAELEEYFRTNARMADEAEAVLLTGTLCVISRPALEVAGGWSGRTTTEDAETGVRLCRHGYSGRLIASVVGRGRLPLALRDLERQRRRWAGGNLQTLIAHAPAIILGRGAMGWRRRGAILSQLTAWLNFSLVPALVLLCALLTGRGGQAAPVLAAASVLLSLIDIVGRLIWRGARDGTSPAVLMAAVSHRLALAPVSALATAEVLMGRRLRFVVTDKSGVAPRRFHDLPLAGLALFAGAALALPAAGQESWFVAAAVLVLMAPFPAALATGRSLDRYRAILTSPYERAPA